MILKLFENICDDENICDVIIRVKNEFYMNKKEESLTKEKLAKFWKEPMAWH